MNKKVKIVNLEGRDYFLPNYKCYLVKEDGLLNKLNTPQMD